ncbi:aminotransferase class I and II [Candidatus Vecturithrix granuli]|uniref:cysteine-S-conjugate beta-lyase n=1 Tax=Vecturithrix granuli TaxID=1499967 RepID=A0A081C775_VECG1|nr:aminotransferase class I and II [Candidatus Vecturithrix granuli]
MHYDFDTIIERRNTQSFKWDLAETLVGEKDVLPLWVADMDFQCPPAVIEAIQRRAGHGIYGYTAVPDSCYQAIINWMKKRHGWNIEKEWIVLTPGVVSGFHWAVRAYTHPGDSVIVQTPVYYPFFKAVKFNGCQMVENQLKFSNGQYEIDFDDLARKFDSRTKVLLLCSPHNPVGRVWTRPELARLANLCLEHNVVLCSDEIHADLIFRGYRHTPTAMISDEIAAKTITCAAANKTFNIAGLQTGFVIISDPVLRDAFVNTKQNLGISSMSNIFGVEAMEAAYSGGEEWLEQLLDYLQNNLEFLLEFVNTRIPKIKVIKPEGTYLVWLDCRALGLEGDHLKQFMLKKAKVWLNNGAEFGSGGAGFQRLNLACPRSILAEALQRIEQAVKTL